MTVDNPVPVPDEVALAAAAPTEVAPVEGFRVYADRVAPAIAENLDVARGSHVYTEAKLCEIVDIFAAQGDATENKKLNDFLWAITGPFDNLHNDILIPMNERGLISRETFVQILANTEGGDQLAEVGRLVAEHPEFQGAYDAVLKSIKSNLERAGLADFQARFLSATQLPEGTASQDSDS